MAGEADQIVQEVVLKGQDDVIAAFASMEQAALGLVAALQKASAVSLFSGLAGTVAAISTAFAGGSVALLKWSESAASAVKQVGNLADVSGSTIEEMSTITAALKLDADSLQTAFRRMSVTIQSAWPEIQKAQRDAASTIQKDMLDLRQAYLGLEQAQVKAAAASQTVAAQMTQNANSVKGAELALIDAQLALRKLNGETIDPQIDEQITKRKALLAVEQATIALAEAKRKAQQDAILAQNQIAAAEAEAEAAAIKADEARKKLAEDQRNDIRALAKFVDDTAKGFSTAGQNVNVTAKNIVDGLIASLGPGSAAIENFKGSFEELDNATAPHAREAFLKLLDVFKNLEDGTLKMAVAVKLFGRSVDQDFINKLSQGSEKALAAAQRLRELGIVLSGDDLAKAKDLKSSIAQLSNEFAILSQKTALAIAPTFTEVMRNIRGLVEQNVSTFESLGKAITDGVTPAILGFVQALTGQSLSEELRKSLSPEQLVSIDEWRNRVAAIVNVVKTGFSIITGIATATAKVLNTVFGEDAFSALDVTLAAAVIKFGKIYGLILVIGVALDKLTGGGISAFLETMTEKFLEFVKAAGEAISLLGDALIFRITPSQLFERLSQLDTKLADTWDKIDKRSKESGKNTSESLTGSIEAGRQAAEKANKAIADAFGLGTEAGVNKATQEIAKIGPAADAQIAQVKKLNDTIKTLGVGESSSIKTISATDLFKSAPTGTPTDVRGVTLFPPKIVETAKAFGQVFIDAQQALADAKQRTDELDASLEKLADTSGKFAERRFDQFGKFDIGAVDQNKLQETQHAFDEAFSNIKKSIDDKMAAISKEKVPLPQFEDDKTREQLDEEAVQGRLAVLANIKAIPEAIGNVIGDIKTKLFGDLKPGPEETNALVDGFKEIPSKLADVFSKTKDNIVQNLAPSTTDADSFTKPLVDAAQALPEKIKSALSSIGGLFASLAPTVDEANQVVAPISKAIGDLAGTLAQQAEPLKQSMVKPFTEAAAAIGTAFAQTPQAISSNLQGVPAAMSAPVEQGVSAVNEKIATIPTNTAAALAPLPDALSSPFQIGVDRIAGILQSIGPQIDSLVSRINQAAQAAANIRVGGSVDSGLSGDFGAGFAGGTDFPLNGPGSWTSDSILARVSRGEAIIQAPAVHALMNSLGGGIIALLNNFHRIAGSKAGGVMSMLARLATSHSMPKFNVGGIVNWTNSALSFPRFATGALLGPAALAATSRSFPDAQVSGVGPGLVRVDLRTNQGTFKMLAPTDTVAELTRAAINNKLTSAGPAPSWVSRRR